MRIDRETLPFVAAMVCFFAAFVALLSWLELRTVELWHYEIHCVDMHGEPYRLPDFYWTKGGWPQYGESFQADNNCAGWLVGETLGNCAGSGCRPNEPR